jgi:endo-1,3-1,4-beta-glycanase ExoK
MHKCVLSTGTWTHADAAGTLANSGTAANSARLGSTQAASGFYQGDIGVLAVGNTVLNDAAIEALATGEAAWSTAGFVALWTLDQASVATALQDTIGAADQTSINGTSVTADTIPWLSSDVTITGDTATATAAGSNVSIAAGWLVAADSGGATAAGDAVTARGAAAIAASTANAVADGDTIVLTASVVISAGSASAIASGDPALLPGAEAIVATTAAADASGDAVTVRAGYAAVVGAASGNATGDNVGLGLKISAGSGSATATGGSVVIVIPIRIYPTGIPGVETFGTPTVQFSIRPTGIPSGEMFGRPQVFVGSPFQIGPGRDTSVAQGFPATHQWSFFLAYTSMLIVGVSNPPPVIAELVYGTSVKFDVALNRPGSLNLSTILDDDRAQHIVPIKTALLAVRDGVVRWAGPVWTVDRNIESGKIDVSAVGWLDLMDHRQIREPVDRPVETDDVRVDALFDILNGQTDSAGRPQLAPLVYAGHMGIVLQRAADSWGRGNPAGTILNQLAEIESGFDIKIDPLTRKMTTHREQLYGSFYGLGGDRPNALFAMGLGPDNVAALTQHIDGSTLANVINAVPDTGKAQQGDLLESIDEYGTFEADFPMTGGSISVPILQSGAMAEVYFRSQPRVTYDVSPAPWKYGGNVPRIFTDYDIGDMVRLAAEREWFRLPEDRSSGEPAVARVMGATVSIDENGEERVDSLKLAVITSAISGGHTPDPPPPDTGSPGDGVWGGVYDPEVDDTVGGGTDEGSGEGTVPQPGDTDGTTGGTGDEGGDGGEIVVPPEDPDPPVEPGTPDPTSDPIFATLMYEEQFDGSSVDTTQWTRYNGDGHDGNGLRDPASLTVHDGTLDVRAWWDGTSIRSGGMSHVLNQVYGRWEVRIKTDADSSGQLSGLALTWPQSENHPHDGENDFYETAAGDPDRNPFSSFIHHYNATSVSDQTEFVHNANATDWHVMRMDWTPQYIKVYRDGVLAGQLTDVSKIPSVAHHLAIQLDALSNDPLSGDVHMYVDYVKVWAYTPEEVGEPPVVTPPPTTNNAYSSARRIYRTATGAKYPLRGQNVHTANFSFGQGNFDSMGANGMNAQRLNAQWKYIEPQRGAFDEAQIAYVKSSIDKAAAAGVDTILCLLINSPQWSQKHVIPSWTYTEAGPVGGYAPYNTQSMFDCMVVNGKSYIQKMVSTFCSYPNVIGFEFCNEPDHFPGAVVQSGTNIMLNWAREADTTDSKLWFVATTPYSSASAAHTYNTWSSITDWTRVVLTLHCYFAPKDPADDGWASNGMRASSEGTFWNGGPEATSYNTANKYALRRHFESFKALSREKGVPWILGEVGVQYNKADAAQRDAWARDVVEAAVLEECSGIFWWIYGVNQTQDPWTSTLGGVWRAEAKRMATMTIGF